MKYLVFVSLFLIALLERVVFDLGPNVELVTASMLLAGAYLGRRWGLGLVLSVMILSDIILGNTNIFLFTWTGFAIPAILAGIVFDNSKTGRPFLATGMGLGANLFFYLWTNFGVWALDGWGMYSNDLNGLAMSYVNGLPFLRLQLTGTLVFVPLAFFVTELLRAGIGNIRPIVKSFLIIKNSS